MKIRTDFVTNSSSSSFVAILSITLDNGEKRRLVKQKSSGGEGDGWIVPPSYDYELPDSSLMPLEDLSVIGFNINGKRLRVKNGKLTLQCHTYGEYWYEADPMFMMERHINSSWKDIFLQMNQIKQHGDDKKLLEELRKIQFLDKYSDASLLNIYNGIKEHKSDTEIIQTLNEDGTMEISIRSDDGLFNLSNFDDDYDIEDDEDDDNWEDE